VIAIGSRGEAEANYF